MKSFLCVLVLLAVCSVQAAPLFAVHSHSVSELLSQGHDVRGEYGASGKGFALVFTHKSLAAVERDSTFIHDVQAEDEVVITELVGPKQVEFVHSMHACKNVATVKCFETACVSVFPKEKTSQFHACVPINAELVLLPFATTVVSEDFNSKAMGAKSPVIEELVSQVSQNTLTGFLVELTNFQTRNSQSTYAVEASNYLLGNFQRNGFNASREFFRTGYSDNVIADFPGTVNASKIVIVGAHYDCRMSNLNDINARAPGANDDGSGTATLLEIARIIGANAIKLPYTLRLIAFSGEEQGLYGSTFYANRARQLNWDIIAMIQGDMIAYQRDANVLGLDLTSRLTTPELNAELSLIIKQYVPELTLGSNTGCCSDQQPFFNNGYRASALIHAGSAGADPQYHQTGDVVTRPGYSLALVQAISRAILAGALTIAGLQ